MDYVALLNYARGLLARLGQGGWRPYFGWGLGTVCLLAVKFALVDAPRVGVTLDSNYYNFLLGVLGIFVATFLSRGVEKVMERTQPGPYVNPHGGPNAP